MAPRVDADDVRVILDTNITDAALTVAVEAANAYVEEHVTGHTDAPGETVLTLIERFLAAHFAAASDPQGDEIAAGDVRITYEGEAGEGFAQTRFGRRAIALDPTGGLEAAGKPAAIFETFGHDAEDWS